MIASEKLLALALDELDGAEAEEVEAHVLRCGACAAQLERWLAIGDDVRRLARAGKVRFGVTPELAEKLEGEGLITRVYRAAPGGSVQCTAAAKDIYAVAYLTADLGGVARLSLITEEKHETRRVDDLPFDVARGLVAYVVRGDYIRALPTYAYTLRLISVEASGDREIARYTFNHTAYVP
jgi:hypothetical protein